MSTASSIAQFMALLSGGVNPALLRQSNGSNMAVDTNAKQTGIDFQSLVVTKSESPVNAQTFMNAANSDDMQMLENISLSQIAALPEGPMKQAALAKFQSMSDKDFPAAAVWQFIRQQASVDGENAIVLNLSEKGIPQEVIDDLKQLFGTNDLITVLRDPKLNTQLDNALKDVDSETIETPQLASVIDAILNQNKGDISNTITFKVDENKSVEQVLDALINGDYIEREVDSVDATAILVPVEIKDAKQPVTLTFVQQQLAGDPQPLQAVTPLANSANPFLKAQANTGKDGEALAPLTNAGLEKAAQAIANNGGQAAESIADRLSNVISTSQGQSTNSQSADFSSLMVSSDGNALMDADGNFIMPFEAGFKTASQAANPVTMQQSATQSHPTTQMVALSLTKMASKAAGGEETQSYRLKLDPPEMGRVDIEMDIIEKTGQLKAVISAEKPESLGLLQRDMHVLLKAMQDAGFEGMTQNDLTFNLSQDQGQMAENNGKGGGNEFGSSNNAEGQAEGDIIAIEGEMTLIVDPVTGQRHINMIV